MKTKSQTCISKKLSEFSEITYFLSLKPFFLRGPKYNGEYLSSSEQNKVALGEDYQLPLKHIICLDQVHSNTVVRITADNMYQTFTADACYTDIPGLMLVILASDCVPILIYHSQKNIIGVIHAGWRGLQSGIISLYFQKIHEDFQMDGGDCQVYIGPSISVDYYEVGVEVAEYFRVHFPESVFQNPISGDKYNLDLKKIAQTQLITAGCSLQNIELSSYCTYQESELFHSYRRHTKLGEPYVGNNTFGISIS